MDYPESAVQALLKERDELKLHCERLQSQVSNTGYPPGHFYSPVVGADDPEAAKAVRNRLSRGLPRGVDIDEERIGKTLDRLATHYPSFPFQRDPHPAHRFFWSNPFFGCHDAVAYFSMLLEFRPRRVMEVGCGHSSCLLLDTNEMFFGGAMEIALIDPALGDMSGLFGPRGTGAARLIEQPLQRVPAGLFESLEANDILFIDSSHVCKTGSDVNFYLFEILPRLKPGVLIHIHDILFPFEYPEAWVFEEKRSWNEAYAVRAFLSYNSHFEIVYWTNLAFHRMGERLRGTMPLCLENEGGSLWLRKKS